MFIVLPIANIKHFHANVLSGTDRSPRNSLAYQTRDPKPRRNDTNLVSTRSWERGDPPPPILRDAIANRGREQGKKMKVNSVRFRLRERRELGSEGGSKRESEQVGEREVQPATLHSHTPSQLDSPKLNQICTWLKPKPNLFALAKFAQTPTSNATCTSANKPNKNHTWFTQAKHRALTAPRAGEQCR